MKSITIIGNLGADAVRRVTSDGRELMSFNVAVSRGEQSPLWFNCVGNLREKLFPYLIKGQCVCVNGDLRAGVYNNSVDLSIGIDTVVLCGAKPDEKKDESK